MNVIGQSLLRHKLRLIVVLLARQAFLSIQTLYHYVADSYDLTSTNVIKTPNSYVLSRILTRYDEFRSTRAWAGVVFDQGPVTRLVTNQNLHFVWASITRPNDNLRDEASLPVVQREVKVWREWLIDWVVIFQHVFYHVVRFMDRIPSTVLVLMLHCQWKRRCHLCHLGHSLEIVSQVWDHVTQLFIFVS